MKKHLAKVIRAVPKAQIIVADDNSSDGSVEYIKKNFPNVEVVTNARRQGFAGNVDSGAAYATGEIIVLLNTDVEPDTNFLTPLLSHFTDPDVFAVGCMERSFENGKIVLRGRGIAKWEKGYYIHAKGNVSGTDTAWVSGGSAAFRRLMWEKLGGMDTLFNPFYWEDIDLSYRARKIGWRSLFESKSIINHYHEEGKIKSEFTPTDVKRISYRNQYIFIWKNLTDAPIFFSHFFWLPIRIIQSLLRGDVIHFQGFLLALKMVNSIADKRHQLLHEWRRKDKELFVRE